MSDGGNNIYTYMTSDRKLNGENSKSETRSLINYFEKNTGVFNGDGVLSAEELKAIRERAKAPKNFWHGFISLSEELSYKIDTPEKCMRLVKRTFGAFFRDMGLDPKNIDLICALHKDKPHHLHIHFWFAEKKPKCKYRKKQTEYRHKGKIEKSVIDRMKERLIFRVTERDEKLYKTRDEALRELKKLTCFQDIVSKDEVKKAVSDLAKSIPGTASFYYGKKDMEPYREQIESVIKKLLSYDKAARKADVRFYTELDLLRRKITGFGLPEAISGRGHTDRYQSDPKNMTPLDEIESEYKRRQGNILLSAVKRIKPEIYETKFRRKANDQILKRRLAISRRKAGKLFDGFLSSFGTENELLQRDFSNRLQEIEEEIEEERQEEKRRSAFYSERSK